MVAATFFLRKLESMDNIAVQPSEDVKAFLLQPRISKGQRDASFSNDLVAENRLLEKKCRDSP